MVKEGRLAVPVLSEYYILKRGSACRLSFAADEWRAAIPTSTPIVPLPRGNSRMVNQLNCLIVAKESIKLTGSRKQVRHLCNGGKPPPGSAPGATVDPENNKPDGGGDRLHGGLSKHCSCINKRTSRIGESIKAWIQHAFGAPFAKINFSKAYC